VSSRTGPIRQPAVFIPRRNTIVALENGAPDFTALQAALPEQDTDADLLCYSTMFSTFCSMTEPTCDHNRFPIAGQGLRPTWRTMALVTRPGFAYSIPKRSIRTTAFRSPSQKAGTYGYSCGLHPRMQGGIHVRSRRQCVQVS